MESGITEEEIRKAVEAALQLQKETPEGFTTAEYVVASGRDPAIHHHRAKALTELKDLIEAGKIEPVQNLLRHNVHGRVRHPDGWRLVD
jgi:hypothetical protein